STRSRPCRATSAPPARWSRPELCRTGPGGTPPGPRPNWSWPCRVEALLDGAPVHDVPPRVQVLGPAVLVGQVVRVLPDVDPEHRAAGPVLHRRPALVGRRVPGEPGAVPDEPCPAGAEPLRAGVVDGHLQLVEAAERVVDRVGERAARLAAAVRRHDRPEERV